MRVFMTSVVVRYTASTAPKNTPPITQLRGLGVAGAPTADFSGARRGGIMMFDEVLGGENTFM